MLPRLSILGAGSIGCFLGARLAQHAQAPHAQVSLLARGAMLQELRAHGLSTRDLDGRQTHLSAAAVPVTDDPQALAQAELILVCVKSAATEQAAAQIAAHAHSAALVVSMQNGLHNAEILRAGCPQQVLAGMVPFNVVHLGAGRFQRSTSGDLVLQSAPELTPWLAVFQAAGLPLKLSTDMPGVQWGKLLLNLNNAVNALSGLPLQQQLGQRSYRRALALLQREALALLKQAGVRSLRVTPVPNQLLPSLLELPDFFFKRLAKRMLDIDPSARSSMWEDLEKGRATEIDSLNAEIVRLAASLGTDAPTNRRISAAIRAAERGGRRDFTGPELLAMLHAR